MVRRQTQRGATLVELMIGLTLGLVLAATLLTLYADASRTGQGISRASAQVENGRYAMDLFAEELRLAGYFAELPLGGAIYSTPDPCATTPVGFQAAPLTVPAPVQGYRATDPLDCLTDRRPGTDAVVVRRLSTTPVAPSALTGSNRRHFVQNSLCVDDPANRPLVFSRTPSDFTLRVRSCSAVNQAREYLVRIYYVASCNRCGSGGDTIPTLKRVELQGDTLVTTPLVDGVEMLRLEYGFDTDGNGSADQYLLATGGTGATTLWHNVMAMKVHLVTRSGETAGGGLAGAQAFQLGGAGRLEIAADGFVRRAHSQVVRLVNPSGLREAQ
jgi:type IV pilus assembly protein PilW